MAKHWVVVREIVRRRISHNRAIDLQNGSGRQQQKQTITLDKHDNDDHDDDGNDDDGDNVVVPASQSAACCSLVLFAAK